MTFHVRRLAIAALAAISFAGLACGGGGSSARVRVLVAGTELRDGLSVATLWDDGEMISLDAEHESHASGVAIAGSDVYVSGSVRNGDALEAVYWKNGQVVRLTDGTSSSSAGAIAVAGGSVYVVGNEGAEAMLWKDGEATPLTSGALFASAKAIAVTGAGVVHVTGSEMEQIGVPPESFEVRAVAKLWVDGVAQSLADGAAVRYAVPGGIAVSGANVYVAGTTDAVAPDGIFEAALWTNGARQPLTDGSHFAFAEAVALAGADVIVGGSRVDAAAEPRTEEPVIWRNGQLQVYGPGNGRVVALATRGADVYAAGADGAGAKLWVNGTPRVLGDGSNPFTARAIAVQAR